MVTGFFVYNNNLSDNIRIIDEKIVETESQITNKLIVLNETAEKNEDIFQKDKTNLKDPTYNEVLDFLLKDKTDEETYNESSYNCAHFSKDVNNNAEKKGIRSGYVKVELNINFPHALLAFNTTDGGLVFFEPQTDQQVILESGKDYWTECIISGEDHGPGNIVIDYIIYW